MRRDLVMLRNVLAANVRYWRLRRKVSQEGRADLTSVMQDLSAPWSTAKQIPVSITSSDWRRRSGRYALDLPLSPIIAPDCSQRIWVLGEPSVLSGGVFGRSGSEIAALIPIVAISVVIADRRWTPVASIIVSISATAVRRRTLRECRRCKTGHDRCSGECFSHL
jgi:hypothetical protein